MLQLMHQLVCSLLLASSHFAPPATLPHPMHRARHMDVEPIWIDRYVVATLRSHCCEGQTSMQHLQWLAVLQVQVHLTWLLLLLPPLWTMRLPMSSTLKQR